MQLLPGTEEYFLDKIVDLVERYAREQQPVHHSRVPPIKISECHLVAVAGLPNEIGVAGGVHRCEPGPRHWRHMRQRGRRQLNKTPC